ncbi:MAG: hypothetical protein Q9198_001132, partial [Flavoplaca austrocitrina]
MGRVKAQLRRRQRRRPCRQMLPRLTVVHPSSVTWGPRRRRERVGCRMPKVPTVRARRLVDSVDFCAKPAELRDRNPRASRRRRRTEQRRVRQQHPSAKMARRRRQQTRHRARSSRNRRPRRLSKRLYRRRP